MNEENLRAAAEKWMSEDPDPNTVAELKSLLGRGDITETDLADRFAGPLEFGTAGLRGVIGAGPNRMNRAVVLRTTFGLASYLLESDPGAREAGVVIGFDGRRMSREFAEDTACVLAAFGIRAHLFEDYAPTPLTSFAVKFLRASAGVMVTASHNPPEYNGYKAYWKNSAQIIPPVDAAISRAIDKAPSPRDVPRLDVSEGKKRELIVPAPDAIRRAYLDAVRAQSVHQTGDRATPIVYTALHGVGDDLALRAFAEANFTNVFSVPEQQKPDGAFPTVAFPNPEEKGAMDLSLALARKTHASLVLANDPDADRLAVAVPNPSSPTGYTQLTGNQVGILMGHYLITEGRVNPRRKERAVLASIVSSPMLGFIARALGVTYEETLTGFKWIANRAMQLEAERAVDFVFGYEEALGYTVGDTVRDKDGISAAVMMAEIACVLVSRGSSVLHELESIARKYGLFVSAQVNLVRKGVEGAKEIQAIMGRLRANPPVEVGGLAVDAVSDFQTAARTNRDGSTALLTLPKSNVLTFDLEGACRIIARPSGTEPKIKFYFDVREPVQNGEPMTDVEARAALRMKALSEAFVAIAV